MKINLLLRTPIIQQKNITLRKILKIIQALNNNHTDQLITQVIKGIEEVKGEDIAILDLRKLDNTVSDYFIVCSGSSNTQVDAITNSIKKTASKALQDKPFSVEGAENSEWVIMDYINLVVHVFQKQIREYYAIEDLWGDAEITNISTNY